MSNQINSDLLRGNINTIILKVLYEGDRYGYEIIKAVEDKTMGEFKLKQPTLYSCLNRLESQGFISSYYNDEEENKTGAKRRYYKMTENGKRYFLSLREDWEYSRTMFDLLISEQEYIVKPKENKDTENNLDSENVNKIINIETKADDKEENRQNIINSSAASEKFIGEEKTKTNEIKENSELKKLTSEKIISENIIENKSITDSNNNFTNKSQFSEEELSKVAASINESEKSKEENVFLNLPEFMLTETTQEEKDKQKIEQYFSEYDINVKFNEKEAYKKDKSGYVFINKLNLLSSFIVYILFSIELLIFGLVQNSFENINPMHNYIYVAYALLGLIYFLYRLTQYINSPYYNLKVDLSINNAIYTKLVPYICYIAAIVVFGICFRNILNDNNLLLAVILFPPLYLFDLILEPVIKMLTAKKFYVNKN